MPWRFDYNQNLYKPDPFQGLTEWEEEGRDLYDGMDDETKQKFMEAYPNGHPFRRYGPGPKNGGLELYVNDAPQRNKTGGAIGEGRFEICRFRGFKIMPWVLLKEVPDALLVTTDRDINLHGVLLPSVCDSSQAPGTFQGKIEIWENEIKWDEIKDEDGEGTGVSTPYRDLIFEQEITAVEVPYEEDWGIAARVPLTPPEGKDAITLKAGVTYDMIWYIEGPHVCRGVDGLEECEMAGVNFRFEFSESSDNGTIPTEGYVPGFVWSHA